MNGNSGLKFKHYIKITFSHNAPLYLFEIMFILYKVTTYNSWQCILRHCLQCVSLLHPTLSSSAMWYLLIEAEAWFIMFVCFGAHSPWLRLGERLWFSVKKFETGHVYLKFNQNPQHEENVVDLQKYWTSDQVWRMTFCLSVTQFSVNNLTCYCEGFIACIYGINILENNDSEPLPHHWCKLVWQLMLCCAIVCVIIQYSNCSNWLLSNTLFLK